MGSIHQKKREVYQKRYQALDEKCNAFVKKEIAKRQDMDEPPEALDPLEWIDKWGEKWNEPMLPSTRNFLIVFTNGINRDVWRLLSEQERTDLLLSSSDLCTTFGATFEDGSYQPGPVTLVSYFTTLTLMGLKETAEKQEIDPSLIGFGELFSSSRTMKYLQERLSE